MGARLTGGTDESPEVLASSDAEINEPTVQASDEEAELDPDTKERLQRISRAQELEKQHWSCNAKVKILDGRVGSISSHDEASGKFVVDLAAKDTVSLSSDGFLFDEDDDMEDQDYAGDEVLSSSQRAALKLARSFFIPGSFFSGTIAIPGFQQYAETERQLYTFHVARKSRDELGKPILLARHAAYGDEQSCHLHMTCSSFASDSSGSGSPVVKACWEDGETICEGVVDLSDGKCVVRGDVKQLVQGEKGFYERGTAVSHTFEISRVTTCKTEAKYNVLVAEAQIVRVNELSSAFWTGRKGQELFARLGLDLPWRDIVFTDACRLCEDECATLRRHSSMLDELQFDSPTSKDATLKRFSVAGINRNSKHTEIDRQLVALNLIISVASRSRTAEEEIHLEIPYLRMKAQHRLFENFQRFDQSLRAAEGRIPNMILDRWRRSGKDAAGFICTVCSIAAEDSRDEVFAELPCGHWFHFDCVKDWLHAHRTCPNCRMDLSVDSSSCEPDSSCNSHG